MADQNVTMSLDVLPGSLAGITTAAAGFGQLIGSAAVFTKMVTKSTSAADSFALTLTAGLGLVAVESSKAFGEFERAMKIAQAVSGQTSRDMSQLGNKINELSVNYRMSIDKMTDGLQTLGRAGLKSVNTQLDVLETGLGAAKLSGIELNDVLEKIVQTTSLLGGDIKSTNFSAQVTDVTDKIIATSMTAPIDMNDVVQTLSFSGGTAAAGGMNIQNPDALYDYLGAISAFAQKGVTGSIAGTALRAFFTKPASQDKAVVEALGKVNMNPEDLWEKNGQKMKTVSEQIGMIHKAMEKNNMSTLDQIELWGDIVGAKMGQQMMKLDESTIRETAQDIRTMSNSQDLAKQSLENYASDLAALEEQAMVVWRNIGEGFASIIDNKTLGDWSSLLKMITGLVQFFSSDWGVFAIRTAIIGLFSYLTSRLSNVLSLFRSMGGLLKSQLTEATTGVQKLTRSTEQSEKSFVRLGLTKKQAESLSGETGKVNKELRTSSNILEEFLIKLNQIVEVMRRLYLEVEAMNQLGLTSIDNSQYQRYFDNKNPNLRKNELVRLSKTHGLSYNELFNIYNSDDFSAFANKRPGFSKYGFATASDLDSYLKKNQLGAKYNPDAYTKFTNSLNASITQITDELTQINESTKNIASKTATKDNQNKQVNTQKQFDYNKAYSATDYSDKRHPLYGDVDNSLIADEASFGQEAGIRKQAGKTYWNENIDDIITAYHRRVDELEQNYQYQAQAIYREAENHGLSKDRVRVLLQDMDAEAQEIDSILKNYFEDYELTEDGVSQLIGLLDKKYANLRQSLDEQYHVFANNKKFLKELFGTNKNEFFDYNRSTDYVPSVGHYAIQKDLDNQRKEIEEKKAKLEAALPAHISVSGKSEYADFVDAAEDAYIHSDKQKGGIKARMEDRRKQFEGAQYKDKTSGALRKEGVDIRVSQYHRLAQAIGAMSNDSTIAKSSHISLSNLGINAAIRIPVHTIVRQLLEGYGNSLDTMFHAIRPDVFQPDTSATNQIQTKIHNEMSKSQKKKGYIGDINVGDLYSALLYNDEFLDAFLRYGAHIDQYGNTEKEIRETLMSSNKKISAEQKKKQDEINKLQKEINKSESNIKKHKDELSKLDTSSTKYTQKSLRPLTDTIGRENANFMALSFLTENMKHSAIFNSANIPTTLQTLKQEKDFIEEGLVTEKTKGGEDILRALINIRNEKGIVKSKIPTFTDAKKGKWKGAKNETIMGKGNVLKQSIVRDYLKSLDPEIQNDEIIQGLLNLEKITKKDYEDAMQQAFKRKPGVTPLNQALQSLIDTAPKDVQNHPAIQALLKTDMTFSDLVNAIDQIRAELISDYNAKSQEDNSDKKAELNKKIKDLETSIKTKKKKVESLQKEVSKAGQVVSEEQIDAIIREHDELFKALQSAQLMALQHYSSNLDITTIDPAVLLAEIRDKPFAEIRDKYAVSPEGQKLLQKLREDEEKVRAELAKCDEELAGISTDYQVMLSRSVERTYQHIQDDIDKAKAELQKMRTSFETLSSSLPGSHFSAINPSTGEAVPVFDVLKQKEKEVAELENALVIKSERLTQALRQLYYLPQQNSISSRELAILQQRLDSGEISQEDFDKTLPTLMGVPTKEELERHMRPRTTIDVGKTISGPLISTDYLEAIGKQYGQNVSQVLADMQNAYMSYQAIHGTNQLSYEEFATRYVHTAMKESFVKVGKGLDNVKYVPRGSTQAALTAFGKMMNPDDMLWNVTKTYDETGKLIKTEQRKVLETSRHKIKTGVRQGAYNFLMGLGAIQQPIIGYDPHGNPIHGALRDAQGNEVDYSKLGFRDKAKLAGKQWLGMGMLGGAFNNAQSALSALPTNATKMSKAMAATGGLIAGIGHFFGPLEVGMTLVNGLMQLWAAEIEKFNKALSDAESKLSEAQSGLDEAIENYEDAYSEKNPKATQEQKDEAYLNALYSSYDKKDGLDRYRHNLYNKVTQVAMNTGKVASLRTNNVFGDLGWMAKNFWTPINESLEQLFDNKDNEAKQTWAEDFESNRNVYQEEYPNQKTEMTDTQKQLIGLSTALSVVPGIGIPLSSTATAIISSIPTTTFKSHEDADALEKTIQKYSGVGASTIEDWNRYSDYIDKIEDLSDQSKYVLSVMEKGIDQTGPSSMAYRRIFGSDTVLGDYQLFEKDLQRNSSKTNARIAQSINDDPAFFRRMGRMYFGRSPTRYGKLALQGSGTKAKNEKEDKILTSIMKHVGGITKEQAKQTLVLSTISELNGIVRDQIEPQLVSELEASMTGLNLMGSMDKTGLGNWSVNSAVNQGVSIISAQLASVVQAKQMELAAREASSLGLSYEEAVKISDDKSITSQNSDYTDEQIRGARELNEKSFSAVYDVYGARLGLQGEDLEKNTTRLMGNLKANNATTYQKWQTIDKYMTWAGEQFLPQELLNSLNQDVVDYDNGTGAKDSGDKDKKDSNKNSKNWVNLAICNKKEIPKLNVNLFKKPPNFTILNRNFKLRDVNVNTADDAKSIQNAVKNSIIEIQNRSNPKIIQDDAAEYDPVNATEGNTLPVGTKKTE